MTVAENLWPEVVGGKGVPEPVKTLREQGVALSQNTKGKLYGEVLEGQPGPFTLGAPYDFYLCVANKKYRYLLLSIECGLLFDYPVTIRNSVAGTTTVVGGEKQFKEHLRLILRAPATKDLLERLLVFANQ